MKKILSIILILTMLSLPLAVQCSASKSNYNFNSSYSQNYKEDKENQKNYEYNGDGNNNNNNKCNNNYGVKYYTEKVEAKKDKCLFSKIGSFFSKALLFATVVVGATVALCKWSPNGEFGTAVRGFYDNTLVPGAKSSYNYAKEKATKSWNSLKQNVNNLYTDTLKPGAQTFFNTTIPDAFGSVKDWTSNICVQPNTLCNSEHYGSACDNTNNSQSCEKTLGQLVIEGKVWTSEKWNKFNNLCIIDGQDGKCQTAVKDVFGKVAKVYKNNWYKLKVGQSLATDSSACLKTDGFTLSKSVDLKCLELDDICIRPYDASVFQVKDVCEKNPSCNSSSAK